MPKTNVTPEDNRHRPLRRRIRTVFIGIVAVGVVMMSVSFYSAFHKAWGKMVRLDCQCNLRQIGIFCREYAGEHGGRFPSTWGELNFVGEYTNCAKLLRCPLTGHEVGIWTQVDLWADYRLIPGRTTNDSSDLILAFEPLGNHGGVGGNVLFVDGSTQWWPSRLMGSNMVFSAATNSTR